MARSAGYDSPSASTRSNGRLLPSSVVVSWLQRGGFFLCSGLIRVANEERFLWSLWKT